MEYFKELAKFLQQANTNNLKTKHFKSEYLGTNVKVSFGQGGAARIPWISFLIEPNTTSNGIYPVYLYYKELDLLILAHGLSETNPPKQNWTDPTGDTIKVYFENNSLKKPDRYGSSYIYKVYDTNALPPEKIMDSDLNQIIEEYKAQFSNVSQVSFQEAQVQFKAFDFIADLSKSGLAYSPLLSTRFIASLLTKPFVILTGLSGSGKTKLAQAFVQWICQDESQYRIVPVGADWTNREPLLGYPDALNSTKYVKPDSGVLDLLIHANGKPGLPHFLILDEMNLSHVERYFADFLSVMESKETIPLHASESIGDGIPQKLTLPANLFIIGTVNIDETTHMFSPKVLDRASTIEFRIGQEEMEAFLSNAKPINMEGLTANGAEMAKSFLQLAENKSTSTKDSESVNRELLRFFRELQKTGAEFGYRSATEILRLMNQLQVLDDTLSTNQKLDIAIIQKLLPKLHGSRRKLCPVLETLADFCLDGSIKVQKDIFENENFDFRGAEVRYPLSLEKIARMYRGAIDNGFASFAEA